MVVVVRHRLLAGPVWQYYGLFPRYLLNDEYTPMGQLYGNRDYALLGPVWDLYGRYTTVTINTVH